MHSCLAQEGFFLFVFLDNWEVGEKDVKIKKKKYRKNLSGVIDYSRGILLKYIEIFFMF